jgi:hypothetical protein
MYSQGSIHWQAGLEGLKQLMHPINLLFSPHLFLMMIYLYQLFSEIAYNVRYCQLVKKDPKSLILKIPSLDVALNFERYYN